MVGERARGMAAQRGLLGRGDDTAEDGPAGSDRTDGLTAESSSSLMGVMDPEATAVKPDSVIIAKERMTAEGGIADEPTPVATA